MKKKVQVLLLTLTMILLCGCGQEEVVKISSSGKITTTIYGYGTPKEVSKKGSIKTVKINGKKYYKFKAKYSPNGESVEVEDLHGDSLTADIEKGHYYVTTYDKDGYVHVTSGASHLDNRDRYYSKAILNKTMFFDIVGELDPNFEFDILKITFPKKIKYTNGKLSKDKMTVTFDYTDFKKGDKIYAYTTAAKSAALSANVGSIKLEGLNKYGHIKKAKTLKVKTKEKIKYIKVNGKKQNSEKIKIKKEGKYKIQVKTNKNIANFEVCYDKTKPKVKILELKNGCKKIVFSDENSGIKYALYGVLHNIESGYIIDPSTYEPDSWTYIEVSDNAGNITKKKVFIN